MNSRILILMFTIVTINPGKIQNAHAFLGTELAPLLQLVAGQVTEIERLTATLHIAQAEAKFLTDLNHGIEQTVSQIQAIQQIIERTQGLDPTGVRSLVELNELLGRAKTLQVELDDMLRLKIRLSDEAIAQSALQSETAYKMGQEMVATGSQLAQESQFASPGRANQITAASNSAQMLSQGVALQTLAQIAQLQALQLDLQKSQVERELRIKKNQQDAFEAYLAASMKKSTTVNQR